MYLPRWLVGLEDAEDALIAEEHLKSELPYPDHSPTSSDR